MFTHNIYFFSILWNFWATTVNALLFQGCQTSSRPCGWDKIQQTFDSIQHISVTGFQQTIADVIRDDMLNSITNIDRFSLMFEGSTDVLVCQNLIVYIRHLVEDKVSLRVEPVTSFLAIKTLHRTKAETIMKEVTEILSEKKNPLEKMSGHWWSSCDDWGKVWGC